MRLFLSIDLNKDIVLELHKLQHSIKSNLSPIDKITLVKPESIHITLKFFGEIEKEKLPSLLHALGSIKLEKFTIDTDKLNYYTKPNGAPRVVFLSFKKSKQLTDLHNAVEDAIKPLGFTKSEFKCHATLFRVRFLKDKYRLMEILKHVQVAPLQLQIESMELFESVIKEDGPTFHLVKKFELK